MTGWEIFALTSGVFVTTWLAALAIWAACAINQADKHLDDESKKLHEKRLTLEAELELAYWHDRDPDK